MAFYAHFDLDLVTALQEQLRQAFDTLEMGELGENNLDAVPDQRGIYQLHHQNVLVYVVKADNSLRGRLFYHFRKISGRQNISAQDVRFKCVSLSRNWAALAPEQILISDSQSAGTCAWNGNGFGQHDPGRNREETNKPPHGFDAMYPIREDWICANITPGGWNCNDLLQALKDELPYLLRYQTASRTKWRQGHPDYNDRIVLVPHANMAASELVKTIATHLDGWQATSFPSHIILYKEQRTYAYGKVLWPE